MTREQYQQWAEWFHEDTGEYPPGELPEPLTRCDEEIQSHIKFTLPIWKSYIAGIERGVKNAVAICQPKKPDD